MDETSTTLSGLLVFAAVVGSYLAADALVRLPRRSSSPLSGDPSLPPLYRRLLPFVLWAGSGIGARFVEVAPRRAAALRANLALAGVRLGPEHVFGLQAVLASAGALAGVLLFVLTGDAGTGAGFALFAAVAGWIQPGLDLEARARRRQEAVVRALPFAIDLIGAAMRAGVDFASAVRHYVQLGLDNPLAAEFRTLLREMAEANVPQAEALDRMADRVRSPEFRSFVDAVAHGLEVGASVADTMAAQGEDLRRARFALAERKAARAPSLMIFPLALFILPAVFIVVFFPVWLRWKASRGG